MERHDPQVEDPELKPVTAVLIVLTLFLVLFVIYGGHMRHGGNYGHFNISRIFDAAEAGAREAGAPPREHLEVSPDDVSWSGSPHRRSVHAALGQMYSTADVDPLVTGQLYGHADNVRNIYAQRSALDDGWGLVEYSSSGGKGDIGVDEGPFGLAEYGGRQVGFDDGIPEAWALPTTPIRWYKPAQRDYYGPEGPIVYSRGLFNPSEPDHDPLVN